METLSGNFGPKPWAFSRNLNAPIETPYFAIRRRNTQPKIIGLDSIPTAVSRTGWSSNRARKALTTSYRHWGYMSIRAVRQTPYI